MLNGLTPRDMLAEAADQIRRYKVYVGSFETRLRVQELAAFDCAYQHLRRHFPEQGDLLGSSRLHKDLLQSRFAAGYPFAHTYDLGMFFNESRQIDSELFAIVYSADESRAQWCDVGRHVNMLGDLRRERERILGVLQYRYLRYCGMRSRAEHYIATPGKAGSACMILVTLINELSEIDAS